MTSRWPDLASLHLLVLVTEHGSVGKAAAEIGLSQAAASRRLDTLERELALPLLIRTVRGTHPTAQGQVVVDWARVLLASATDLVSGVEALQRNRHANLRVAASLTVAEYLVPRWLVSFRAAHPDTDVSLSVTNSEGVGELVHEEKVDLGFIESLTVPRRLAHRTVAEDRLVVVVAPGHPWARRRSALTAAELARTPLVVREHGSGTRTALEALLKPRHQITRPLLELTSNAAVKVTVESGAAPAVLSDLAVASEVRDGRLVAVPVADLALARPLRTVWARRRRLSGASADLVAIALSTGPARPA